MAFNAFHPSINLRISFSMVFQAGVYANSVHLLELDLLLRKQSATPLFWHIFSCLKKLLIWFHTLHTTWQFAGATSTGKRDWLPNVPRCWSSPRSIGIYKQNMLSDIDGLVSSHSTIDECVSDNPHSFVSSQLTKYAAGPRLIRYSVIQQLLIHCFEVCLHWSGLILWVLLFLFLFFGPNFVSYVRVRFLEKQGVERFGSFR